MIMNWKVFGRRWSWPNFKVISQNSPGGIEENHAVFYATRKFITVFKEPAACSYTEPVESSSHTTYFFNICLNIILPSVYISL
jgi:hypothetical protein